jgi:hypothetical protein
MQTSEQQIDRIGRMKAIIKNEPRYVAREQIEEN